MSRTTIISLTILLLSSVAPAQTGDWQAVKNLQPGMTISVQGGTPFHILCVFGNATDAQLTCEHILRGPRGPLIPPERIYTRANIREIRLEHSDKANMATGALIGGSIGAAAGTSVRNGTLTRGGGALLLGGIGALMGGTFNRDFPVTHGKVIYRR